MSGLLELAQQANKELVSIVETAESMRVLIDSLKHPVWLKDQDSRMIIINQAYTEKFGVTASEYEGKTDYEIWPEHIADDYRKNDLQALSRRGHVETYEMVPTSSGEELLYIVKTRLFINDQLYVKGEAFNVNDLEKVVRAASNV